MFENTTRLYLASFCNCTSQLVFRTWLSWISLTCLGKDLLKHFIANNSIDIRHVYTELCIFLNSCLFSNITTISATTIPQRNSPALNFLLYVVHLSIWWCNPLHPERDVISFFDLLNVQKHSCYICFVNFIICNSNWLILIRALSSEPSIVNENCFWLFTL